MSRRRWASPTTDGAYASWSAMRQRCAGKGNNAKYYLGVPIDPAWIDDFDQFYKDMGARPLGQTLDRKDPTKGYSASNCRWATRQEQARNQRRSVVITFAGKSQTLSEWAEELGLPYYMLWNRIRKHGMDPAKALTKNRLCGLPGAHGTTSSYAKGCRCDLCKQARSNWYQKHKERRDGTKT